MTVKVITEDGRPAKSTKLIRYIRYADFTEQDATWQMRLDQGDELFCPGGKVTIELRSRKANARFVFANQFRLVILSDNTIDMRAGKGYVQALSRTAVSSGVIMGSAHTEYAFSVQRVVTTGGYGPPDSSTDQVALEFIVFEGDISITDNSFGKAIETKVSTGEKLRVTPGAASRMAITSDDVTDAAAANASADTGKAMINDRTVDYEITFKQYLGQYAAVLSDPRNAQARLDLAITQLNHGETVDSSYQLAKAETFAPADSSLVAAISVARGDIYTQRGDTAAADAEFNKAMAKDPKVFDEASLTALRFKPAVKQRIQKWHAVHPVPWLLDNEPKARWAIPAKASPKQIELFKLILGRDYDKAARIFNGWHMQEDREWDSIDLYAQAIFFFERQNFREAKRNANEAMIRAKSDGLLTGVEYGALKRILEKSN